jgi:hypothetical protein
MFKPLRSLTFSSKKVWKKGPEFKSVAFVDNRRGRNAADDEISEISLSIESFDDSSQQCLDIVKHKTTQDAKAKIRKRILKKR